MLNTYTLLSNLVILSIFPQIEKLAIALFFVKTNYVLTISLYFYGKAAFNYTYSSKDKWLLFNISKGFQKELLDRSQPGMSYRSRSFGDGVVY